MTKKNLNLKDLKGYVLSPGNIFWTKKSGTEILIAKKADYLNFTLVEKLFNANHPLFIEDQIDLTLQHEFMGLIKAHESEVLFKEKLQWKKRIFELLEQNKLSRFELGQLAWMAWSRIDREEVKTFIDFDIDLFKRSLNVSTSFVFCALLLGYYQDTFLKNLFTSAMKDLMSMEKIELMDKMKAELESMRSRDSLNEEEKEFVKRLYPNAFCWAGERYNGSGVHAFNKREMSDLEKVMVALERHYSYRNVDGETIFDEIKTGTFICDEKLLSLIKKSLSADQRLNAEISA